MLLWEVEMAPYFWAPNEGEPKEKVFAMRSSSKVASVAGCHKSIGSSNKVANRDCPVVVTIRQVVIETMAPTLSTLKRRKVLPTRVVKKTKGGIGRRRTPTDSEDEEDPVVSPYKWSTSTTKVKETKGGPVTISNRAAAVTADTDSAAYSSESEDEVGDSVEVVKKLTTNTGGNLTPAALGG
jgi:hypothetical protein